MEMKNMCSHKDLYTNVYDGFTHNRPKLKTNAFQWTNKLCYIYTMAYDPAIKRKNY